MAAHTVTVNETTNQIVVTTPVQAGALTPATGLIFLGAVTGLTGGGSTNLDGAVISAGVSVPRAYLVIINDLPEIWRLESGTDAEDSAAGIVRPDDYATNTNERVLKRKLLLA